MPRQGRGHIMTETRDITEWLARWRAGESGGEAELIRRIYPVVRAIAHQQIGRREGLISQHPAWPPITWSSRIQPIGGIAFHECGVHFR